MGAGPLDESGSTQRLDWYLNFQIAKATFHQQKNCQRTLIFIRECELQRYDYFPQGSEGLLISASHLLPVRWTLIQPVLDPFANWVRKFIFGNLCNNRTLEFFFQRTNRFLILALIGPN